MTKHLSNIFLIGFLLVSSVGFAQNEMFIFVSDSDTDGDLGTSASEVRANADELCQENAIDGAIGMTIRALLSINATDEIRDMPDNYKMPQTLPIKNEFGVLVANNFPDLIANNLFTAVNSNISENIFSGTNIGGSLASANCTNWTSNSSSTGATFQSNFSEFPGTGSESNCSESLRLACIAFQPLADFEVEGFSRFGVDGPNIKMKYIAFSDTLKLPPTAKSSKEFDIDIDVSKIISIDILTEFGDDPDNLRFAPPNIQETIPGVEYEYDLQGSSLWLRTTENNSTFVLDKPFKVFIIYTE